MWRARFAASEPPEAPGSHSRQRSRAPPAGHWVRNKTHNRESLGDTVQDGERGEGRGKGVRGGTPSFGEKFFHCTQLCRQGVFVCMAFMRVARDTWL